MSVTSCSPLHNNNFTYCSCPTFGDCQLDNDYTMCLLHLSNLHFKNNILMLHGDVHIVKGSTGYIKCLKLFNDHDAV